MFLRDLVHWKSDSAQDVGCLMHIFRCQMTWRGDIILVLNWSEFFILWIGSAGLSSSAQGLTAVVVLPRKGDSEILLASQVAKEREFMEFSKFGYLRGISSWRSWPGLYYFSLYYDPIWKGYAYATSRLHTYIMYPLLMSNHQPSLGTYWVRQTCSNIWIDSFRTYLLRLQTRSNFASIRCSLVKGHITWFANIE